MDPTYFQDLYDYTFWADRQVWGCVMQLSEEQFTRDLGYSLGTLRDQCIHLMAVESWWPRFLHSGTLVFLDPDSYPTRESIRAEWDKVEQFVSSYITTLTTEELQRDVKPDFWEDKQPIKVWQALIQVANHSTDHRAQILAGIGQLGGATVEHGYLSYLFEKQKSG